eukprot:5536535-Amphidinium_carterae.1
MSQCALLGTVCRTRHMQLMTHFEEQPTPAIASAAFKAPGSTFAHRGAPSQGTAELFLKVTPHSGPITASTDQLPKQPAQPISKPSQLLVQDNMPHKSHNPRTNRLRL